MRRFVGREAAIFDSAIRRASWWYYPFLAIAIAYTVYRLTTGVSADLWTILAWQVLSLLWFRAAAVFHRMAAGE